MRVAIEPVMSQWTLAEGKRPARAELAALGVEAHRPVVATGHQAWHWHPGILAKYLAASAFAQRRDAAVLDIVVDQDVYDPLRLELPVRDAHRPDRLVVEQVELGRSDPGVPPGMISAADHAMVVRQIEAIEERLGDRLAVSLARLRDAWREPAGKASLAEQLSVVLHRLMARWTGPMHALTATRLLTLPTARQIVAAMLRDPASCVKHYNAAVEAHPKAGIAPLSVERERIELPLWWLKPGEPRRRVYADVADTTPMLVDERGKVIEVRMEEKARGGAIVGAGAEREMGELQGKMPPRAALAPKAMLLTALARGFYCDFFIHGTGGGVYDRATEDWWRAWRGEALAPMAVVTADVKLAFSGIPLATKDDLERAVWYAHHLPHNVERYAAGDATDAQLVERKQTLLASREADRDRKSRRRSFDEMHRIDAELLRRHAELLQAAEREIEKAHIGVSNAQVAAKRDWCFALYPEASIDELQRLILSA